MKKLVIVSLVIMLSLYAVPFIFNYEKKVDEPLQEPKNDARNISVLIDGTPRNMDIEEYLLGVIAAEMPASFEDEALKAQAVAARTYTTYKKGLETKDASHAGADVCDDFRHCKAYIDIKNEKQDVWKNNTEMYYNKIKNAVDETSGEIITYKEKPIIAAFHSVSSEKTENAKDVWGSETPYLVSVDSPGGELSKKFKAELSFTRADAESKIKAKYPDIILEEDSSKWFKNSSRSVAGGVIDVGLGNTRVKGSVVREIFGLNSTNFTLEFSGDDIIFKTTGYGHGVGMSQYGAQSMALDGSTYIDILKRYYTDTNITKIF